MLTLEKGRPADVAGRLEKEQRVYELLDSLQINYQRVDHGPVMTIAACEEVDQTLGLPVCKNSKIFSAEVSLVKKAPAGAQRSAVSSTRFFTSGSSATVSITQSAPAEAGPISV